jgi:hypothetical protein
MFCSSRSLFYCHVRPRVRRAGAAKSPACVLVWLTTQWERGKTKLSHCISRRYRREALESDGWSTPSSSRITLGKESRYPSYGGSGWASGRSGWVRKTSPRPGFNPGPSSPPAASNYKIPDAPFFSIKQKFKFNVNK